MARTLFELSTHKDPQERVNAAVIKKDVLDLRHKYGHDQKAMDAAVDRHFATLPAGQRKYQGIYHDAVDATFTRQATFANIPVDPQKAAGPVLHAMGGAPVPFGGFSKIPQKSMTTRVAEEIPKVHLHDVDVAAAKVGNYAVGELPQKAGQLLTLGGHLVSKEDAAQLADFAHKPSWGGALEAVNRGMGAGEHQVKQFNKVLMAPVGGIGGLVHKAVKGVGQAGVKSVPAGIGKLGSNLASLVTDLPDTGKEIQAGIENPPDPTELARDLLGPDNLLNKVTDNSPTAHFIASMLGYSALGAPVHSFTKGVADKAWEKGGAYADKAAADYEATLPQNNRQSKPVQTPVEKPGANTATMYPKFDQEAPIEEPVPQASPQQELTAQPPVTQPQDQQIFGAGAVGDSNAIVPAASVPPGQTRRVPPSHLTVDPKRFQWRSSGKDPLANETAWDPTVEQTGLMWKDPANGNVYTVDGHRSTNFANRVKEPGIPMKMSEAKTAEQARIEGAKINIARGNGDPVDAAQVFRQEDFPPEELARLKETAMPGSLAAKGAALANLHDSLWKKVYQGDRSLPVGQAAIIGDSLPPDQQVQFLENMKNIKKDTGTVTEQQLPHYINQYKQAGFADASALTGSQGNMADMMGLPEAMAKSLFVEKSKLSADALDKLSKDKNTLNYISKSDRAKVIAEAGGSIDPDKKAQLLAATDAALKDAHLQLADPSSPLSQQLHEHAGRMSNGEDFKAVADDFYNQVRSNVSKTFQSGQGVADTNNAEAPPIGVPEAGNQAVEPAPAGEQPAVTPPNLYRGISGGEQAVGSGRLGPANYWTDNPAAAEVFADFNKGKVESQPTGDLGKTLDAMEPDTTTPEWSNLKGILASEHGLSPDWVDSVANNEKHPFSVIAKRLYDREKHGVSMFPGADQLNEAVRRSGYDTIKATTRNSPDLPDHTEYARLTPTPIPPQDQSLFGAEEGTGGKLAGSFAPDVTTDKTGQKSMLANDEQVGQQLPPPTMANGQPAAPEAQAPQTPAEYRYEMTLRPYGYATVPSDIGEHTFVPPEEAGNKYGHIVTKKPLRTSSMSQMDIYETPANKTPVAGSRYLAGSNEVIQYLGDGKAQVLNPRNHRVMHEYDVKPEELMQMPADTPANREALGTPQLKAEPISGKDEEGTIHFGPETGAILNPLPEIGKLLTGSLGENAYRHTQLKNYLSDSFQTQEIPLHRLDNMAADTSQSLINLEKHPKLKEIYGQTKLHVNNALADREKAAYYHPEELTDFQRTIYEGIHNSGLDPKTLTAGDRWKLFGEALKGEMARAIQNGEIGQHDIPRVWDSFNKDKDLRTEGMRLAVKHGLMSEEQARENALYAKRFTLHEEEPPVDNPGQMNSSAKLQSRSKVFGANVVDGEPHKSFVEGYSDLRRALQHNMAADVGLKHSLPLDILTPEEAKAQHLVRVNVKKYTPAGMSDVQPVWMHQGIGKHPDFGQGIVGIGPLPSRFDISRGAGVKPTKLIAAAAASKLVSSATEAATAVKHANTLYGQTGAGLFGTPKGYVEAIESRFHHELPGIRMRMEADLQSPNPKIRENAAQWLQGLQDAHFHIRNRALASAVEAAKSIENSPRSTAVRSEAADIYKQFPQARSGGYDPTLQPGQNTHITIDPEGTPIITQDKPGQIQKKLDKASEGLKSVLKPTSTAINFEKQAAYKQLVAKGMDPAKTTEAVTKGALLNVGPPHPLVDYISKKIYGFGSSRSKIAPRTVESVLKNPVNMMKIAYAIKSAQNAFGRAPTEEEQKNLKLEPSDIITPDNRVLRPGFDPVSELPKVYNADLAGTETPGEYNNVSDKVNNLLQQTLYGHIASIVNNRRPAFGNESMLAKTQGLTPADAEDKTIGAQVKDLFNEFGPTATLPSRYMAAAAKTKAKKSDDKYPYVGQTPGEIIFNYISPVRSKHLPSRSDQAQINSNDYSKTRKAMLAQQRNELNSLKDPSPEYTAASKRWDQRFKDFDDEFAKLNKQMDKTLK